jgi:hypothetical protein
MKKIKSNHYGTSTFEIKIIVDELLKCIRLHTTPGPIY